MAGDAEFGQVSKGGTCLFEFDIDRIDIKADGIQGLRFWVRADARIENLIKGLNTGRGINPLYAYGRDWFSPENKDIQVYDLNKDLPGYNLGNPCKPLKGAPSRLGGIEEVNLSFLRFVGISDPGGLKFCVSGPYSKTYVSSLSEMLIKEVRKLCRDYIVPIHFNLRISCQEA